MQRIRRSRREENQEYISIVVDYQRYISTICSQNHGLIPDFPAEELIFLETDGDTSTTYGQTSWLGAISERGERRGAQPKLWGATNGSGQFSDAAWDLAHGTWLAFLRTSPPIAVSNQTKEGTKVLLHLSRVVIMNGFLSADISASLLAPWSTDAYPAGPK